MPSVATRRRRAVNIANRMEQGEEQRSPIYAIPPSSSSSPSSAPLLSQLSVSFVQPTLLSMTLFPLLLLLLYLYVHREDLSLAAAACMVALTAVYLLSFLVVMRQRLQSKQSQPAQHTDSHQHIRGRLHTTDSGCACCALIASISVSPCCCSAVVGAAVAGVRPAAHRGAAQSAASQAQLAIEPIATQTTVAGCVQCSRYSSPACRLSVRNGD
jgi:hypothetical protein